MTKNNSPEHMAAMRAACTPEVRAGSKQIAALKERIHRRREELKELECELIERQARYERLMAPKAHLDTHQMSPGQVELLQRLLELVKEIKA
jgi:septal ring factor EnvC (AmiA/AmiB activator)